jgi:DNA-binding response OmpR family regulator
LIGTGASGAHLAAGRAKNRTALVKHTAAPERVLLIEDDPWVQSVLAELLHDEGYAVSRALTSRDGLRMAEQLRPALIVLDLRMPDTPGVELLRTLKSRAATREVPVLVVSAHPELLEHCRDCADGVHPKPFDVTELIEHVQQLVGPVSAIPPASSCTACNGASASGTT